jgi:hypothetical protein
MDKKIRKPAAAKVGRSATSGKFTSVTKTLRSRSAQTIDRIAERHKRVLKRLADK